MERTRCIYLALLAIAITLVIQLACGISTQGDDSAAAKLTALSESIPKTLTAAAVSEGGNSDDLATAQAEATQRSQDIQSTQTAEASTRGESQLAAATESAPVVAELPLFGVDPSQGHLGWVHEPVTVTVEGYHQFGFADDTMLETVRDFVLAADVTWDTQYGASGCGFMFRSNGDKNKPSQYMLIATRLGNGHVIFTALAEGELANVHDFFPKDQDKSFQWQNGTTNRLVVVGKGTLFEIYTNGVKIGEVDVTQPPPPFVLPPAPKPPTDKADLSKLQDYQNKVKEYKDLVDEMQSNYQIALKNYNPREAIFGEGFVGMIALSESGLTHCQFSDAWLWHIDQ